MADLKLTELTADSTPGGDSLLYTVDDPGGAPVSRKSTITQVLGSAFTQDGGILVGTGASAFQEETGDTLLESIGLSTNLGDLTDNEAAQLKNIDATTISAAQWGYLGAFNQALATTDGPTFAGLSSTSNIKITADGTGGPTNAFTAGVGDDLRIYHNGTDSFLRNYTGDLFLRTEVASSIKFNPNTNLTLEIDSSQNVRHVVDGAAGGPYLSVGADDDLKIYFNGTTSYLYSTSGSIKITPATGTAVEFDSNQHAIFQDQVAINGATITDDALTIDWSPVDNSAAYGINLTYSPSDTSSGSRAYNGISVVSDYYAASGVTNETNCKAGQFLGYIYNDNHAGTLDDLYGIYAASGIYSATANGTVNDAYGVRSKVFFIDSTINNAAIAFSAELDGDTGGTISGNAYMYYGTWDGAGTVSGTVYGIYVTGAEDNYFEGNIRLAEDGSYSGPYISTGADDDLKIYHTGSDGAIRCDTGNLYISTLSTDSLYLRTNSTAALTLDSNQDATFAGDVSITGALSKGSGSFDIPHPNPALAADGYRLRHSFVESPTRGDNLYRYEVEVFCGRTEIQLPDYFEYLNENADVWVNPVGQFAQAYGEVVGDRLIVHADRDGKYKVLVIATRKDEVAVNNFDPLGIEYKKAA